MSVHAKLLKIQADLICPKTQYNAFGKYNYRNCEDILEAVKPLCAAEDCTLYLCDTIVLVGERYYVQASATLHDNEENAELVVTAYAREEHAITGMKESQITGAASSYARKYALNAMFDIDDTKDADGDRLAKKASSKTPVAKQAVPAEVSKLIVEIDRLAKALPESGVDKTSISAAIKATSGSANYNKIIDVATAKSTLAALKAMEG